MKLKYRFEIVDMGDETVFVPVGKNAKEVHGVLKLNSSGKEIVSLLVNDTTEESIVNMLTEKYGNEHEELVSYVHNTIAYLRKAGLIEE